MVLELLRVHAAANRRQIGARSRPALPALANLCRRLSRLTFLRPASLGRKRHQAEAQDRETNLPRSSHSTSPISF
jgi:hypothetical protein